MTLTQIFILLLVLFCFPLACLCIVAWRLSKRAFNDWVTRYAINLEFNRTKIVRGRRVS